MRLRLREIQAHLFESADWIDELDNAESTEEIQHILQRIDAEKVYPHIYSVGDYVIVWEGDLYPEVEKISEWIYRVDVFDLYPEYENAFNKEFWSHPEPLFHATVEKYVKSIINSGLHPSNASRGLNNRGVGDAVFTTSDFDEAIMGHYGDHIFKIDTRAMARDGIKPYVEKEPPVIEEELRITIANKLGYDYQSDLGSDMSPNTVIIHGHIPSKYLMLVSV